MINIQEKKVFHMNGWFTVLLDLIVAAIADWLLFTHLNPFGWIAVIVSVLLIVLIFISFFGFFLIQPNDSKVFTFLESSL